MTILLPMRIFSAFLLFFIFICSAFAFAGQPALPATHFLALDGSTHTFAELNGHISVINFWATWCGPCREEMPRLQKIADDYQSRGVTFVAISLDDANTQPKIADAVEKRSFKITVWKGASDETLKQLDLGVLVPATLVLDEHGTVIGRIEGEARDKDIRSRLDWLLNGRQGKQPKVVQKNDW